MVKVSIPYSLACGVFLIVLFFVTFSFGLNPFLEVSQLLFDACVFGLFIFFCTKDFKARNEGFLHFWQGMTLSFLLSVFATLLFLAALFIYNEVNASLVINYKADATKFLIEKKELYVKQFGEANFELQIAEIDRVTFGGLMMSIGLKKVLVGLFLGPIISIALRKKPN